MRFAHTSPGLLLAALGAGAALVALAGLALWLWRSRPWRGPRTRYPVVLAHGFLGFDQIGIGPLKQDYFRGVAAHLESLGVQVVRPRVAPTASVAERAAELAAAIRALPARRVNVIAHSMGGLDARYAITKLGLAKKVASLTTIGTPHRGTRFADIGTLGLGALFGRIGLGALGDLTTEAMRAFNAEVPDARGVRYGCVLAAVPKDGRGLNPLLLPSFALLRSAGPSDGLVTCESQRWGRVLMRLTADHWGEIGWSTNGPAAPATYEALLCRLRARGL